MRTTVDLDPGILRELKQRQAAQGKTLGELISELLAPVLARPSESRTDFGWHTQDMGLRVDLEDKDAVWRVLDAPHE